MINPCLTLYRFKNRSTTLKRKDRGAADNESGQQSDGGSGDGGSDTDEDDDASDEASQTSKRRGRGGGDRPARGRIVKRSIVAVGVTEREDDEEVPPTDTITANKVGQEHGAAKPPSAILGGGVGCSLIAAVNGGKKGKEPDAVPQTSKPLDKPAPRRNDSSSRNASGKRSSNRSRSRSSERRSRERRSRERRSAERRSDERRRAESRCRGRRSPERRSRSHERRSHVVSHRHESHSRERRSHSHGRRRSHSRDRRGRSRERRSRSRERRSRSRDRRSRSRERRGHHHAARSYSREGRKSAPSPATPEELHLQKRELCVMRARKRECRAEDERMRLAGEIAELEYSIGRMKKKARN